MNQIALLSLLPTAITGLIYYAINYLQFDHGIKWWLFGVHLMTAGVGFLVGLFGMMLRQWWGLLSVGVCGYFLWVQLLC